MGKGNKEGTASIAIAYNPYRTLEKDGTVSSGFKPDDTVDALHQPTGNKEPLVADTAVRRLTPTECCRLQGFPDDWLGEPNEPPDGPRYAGLGDAVTVNVAEWIGRRLPSADFRSGDDNA